MILSRLDQWEAKADCPVARSYTRRQARQLTRDAGWTVTAVHKRHVFAYQVGPYKRGLYRRAYPTWFLQSFESLIGWHTIVEARR